MPECRDQCCCSGGAKNSCFITRDLRNQRMFLTHTLPWMPHIIEQYSPWIAVEGVTHDLTAIVELFQGEKDATMLRDGKP